MSGWCGVRPAGSIALTWHRRGCRGTSIRRISAEDVVAAVPAPCAAVPQCATEPGRRSRCCARPARESATARAGSLICRSGPAWREVPWRCWPVCSSWIAGGGRGCVATVQPSTDRRQLSGACCSSRLPGRVSRSWAAWDRSSGPPAQHAQAKAKTKSYKHFRFQEEKYNRFDPARSEFTSATPIASSVLTVRRGRTVRERYSESLVPCSGSPIRRRCARIAVVMARF
jgi:hypothetical protein